MKKSVKLRKNINNNKKPSYEIIIGRLLACIFLKIMKTIWVHTKCIKSLKGMQKTMLDKIALALVIIGALNWGSIGIFSFDIVAWLFGGQGALLSRVIYTLVALGGIWCVSLLFRDTEHAESSIMK